MLPQGLSLNIAAGTNVYDRTLKRDLDNGNPSFLLHPDFLKIHVCYKGSLTILDHTYFIPIEELCVICKHLWMF